MQALLFFIEEDVHVANKKGEYWKYFGYVSPGGMAKAEPVPLHIADAYLQQLLAVGALLCPAFHHNMIDQINQWDNYGEANRHEQANHFVIDQ